MGVRSTVLSISDYAQKGLWYNARRGMIYTIRYTPRTFTKSFMKEGECMAHYFMFTSSAIQQKNPQELIRRKKRIFDRSACYHCFGRGEAFPIFEGITDSPPKNTSSKVDTQD